MWPVSVVVPVFENGRAARAAVDCLLSQAVPSPELLQIIVVDDGSKSEVATFFTDLDDRRIQLQRLATNCGRSTACNAGAAVATGEVLIFMDCDCQPETAVFIASHADNLARGHVASTGHVLGSGGGFWERYQTDASIRRERRFRKGRTYAGNSNFAVTRSAFQKVDGFDPGYRHYGFEDRDLLIRLAKLGTISWAEAATVRHLDTLTLLDVCRKMVVAGEKTSGRFARSHPDAYEKLGYAMMDVRAKAWLRPFATVLGPLFLAATPWLDVCLQSSFVPYLAKRSIVKVSSAMAFAYGTSLSDD